MRVRLEDVNGSETAVLEYAAEPSERAKAVRWQGRSYRQNREDGEGWVYRDCGEPQNTLLDSSKYLSVPTVLEVVADALEEVGEADENDV